MSDDLGGLYDRDPTLFRREVEKLRDRAILPPRTRYDILAPSDAIRLANKRHRVSVDAEFLLDLIVMVEQQMMADGREPLGPGPYDCDRA